MQEKTPPDASMSSICIKTIVGIRKMSRFLDKYSKYLDTKYHVTLPQLLCLSEVYASGSITLTELTRRLNMNNSAMTGIIDRLESKGLLYRIRKDRDRRTVCIECTEAGGEYTDQLQRVLETECFFDASRISERQLFDICESLERITLSLDPEVRKISLDD
ncbi:MarR family transcriptional regulator [Desulfobulbus alkaliphilus]|uniref:MarR family transcriptional regulator n=1 Tax=Desulfobulbus alkaliphilus TaxID=869814 RepID=UPI001964CE29|nr:MarR family transcriptional regulator [Desulfobulbus alkaliphilus]MBM9535530.1 MarR family transcriptional regulator [Desulfobulbus alkaliphilus]